MELDKFILMAFL